MTRVTVGLPFYNNKSTLSAAIRSALNQTYSDFVLLMIDDGSSDGSLEIAESFDDPRIRLIRDGGNKGLAARLNELAELTETEFLFRMDADDIMHPERLAVQVERLNGDDQPDLVSSAAWVMSPDREIQGRLFMAPNGNITSSDILLRHQGIVHPTVAGRTEWFRAHPYRANHRRTEDWELWVRTMDTTNHVAMSECLLFYLTSSEVGLANYRIAKREQRKIVLSQGPRLIGWWKSRVVALRLWAEELIMALAARTGQSGRFIDRRHDSLTDEQLRQAEGALRIALGGENEL